MIDPADDTDDRELLLANPAHPVGDDRFTLCYTMNETTRLRRGVADKLNRCAGVVVPSHWVADRFRDDGVTAPIHVATHGVDHAIFNDRDDHPADRPDTPCTFGVSGRMAHGGVRKGIAEAIAAFRAAFDGVSDVRLRVKIWPDCPLPPADDDRIEVVRRGLTEAEMADWYRSLDAYLSASCGEGFGLQPLEAMACGRPPIITGWSGDGEYFRDDCGYRLEYVLEPGYGEYDDCGMWGRPTHESMVERLREVYRDRRGAAERGRRAAEHARKFTWEYGANVIVQAFRALPERWSPSGGRAGVTVGTTGSAASVTVGASAGTAPGPATQGGIIGCGDSPSTHSPVIVYHAPDPTNLGDLHSNPARYFDFLRSAEVRDLLIDPAEFRRLNADVPAGTICIVGGGGLLDDGVTRGNLRWMMERYSEPAGVAGPGGHCRFISWAAGANAEVARWDPWEPVPVPPIAYPAGLMGRFALHGVRDVLAGGGAGESTEPYPWVPCASCMAPIFDEARDSPIIHDYVVYDHRSFPLPVLGDWPALRNDGGPAGGYGTGIERAVRHIASGRYVITSSYHGAYWATLLGRTVLAVAFSSKFRGLPHVTLTGLARLYDDVPRASPAPAGYLEECRRCNRWQAARVLQAIDGGPGRIGPLVTDDEAAAVRECPRRRREPANCCGGYVERCEFPERERGGRVTVGECIMCVLGGLPR